MQKYYAHRKEVNGLLEWEDLIDHLESTAQLAADNAEPFGCSAAARAAAYAHDGGKATKAFQARLAGCPERVDHSTLGAQLIFRRYSKKDSSLAKLLAFPVAGHHCGLPDGGTLADTTSLSYRLKKALPEPIDPEVEAELISRLPASVDLPSWHKNSGFTSAFLIRMLYSCLTDADFLETERFMEPDKFSTRGSADDIKSLHSRFSSFISSLQSRGKLSSVNRIRTRVYNDCIAAVTGAPKGAFSMTVPTGGGKTYASFGTGVTHAEENDMRRIIYVIPYTSIIEQTGDALRRAVGDAAVLEHHSNFDALKKADAEQARKWDLAAENWDAPVVVTTSVQFYESLFGNKPGACRKLHNIANSVIILDEAQMIPVEYLKPILTALGELIVHYGCSVILCTATQPEIGEYLPVIDPSTGERLAIRELVPDPAALQDELKRVKVQYCGELSDKDVVKRMMGKEQALAIVNTRRHALAIYNALPKDGSSFHLSSAMCPAHRKQVLSEIKTRLKSGKPCRVVSTQLIECGVDVDFPVVLRSMAGLDSIAQAAGRCNREGNLPYGDVYVFDTTNKLGVPSGWLKTTANYGRMALCKHISDPLSVDAMRDYFRQIYSANKRKLDKKDIIRRFEERALTFNFPLESVARDMKIIEDAGRSIVIPWDSEAEELMDDIRAGRGNWTTTRRLQRYTVNVWNKAVDAMLGDGSLEDVDGTGAVLALKKSAMGKWYGEGTGVAIDIV